MFRLLWFGHCVSVAVFRSPFFGHLHGLSNHLELHGAIFILKPMPFELQEQTISRRGKDGCNIKFAAWPVFSPTFASWFCSSSRCPLRSWFVMCSSPDRTSSRDIPPSLWCQPMSTFKRSSSPMTHLPGGRRKRQCTPPSRCEFCPPVVFMNVLLLLCICFLQGHLCRPFFLMLLSQVWRGAEETGAHHPGLYPGCHQHRRCHQGAAVQPTWLCHGAGAAGAGCTGEVQIKLPSRQHGRKLAKSNGHGVQFLTLFPHWFLSLFSHWSFADFCWAFLWRGHEGLQGIHDYVCVQTLHECRVCGDAPGAVSMVRVSMATLSQPKLPRFFQWLPGHSYRVRWYLVMNLA